MGLELWAAYGNGSTDIQAFEAGGIPKERTFILGSNGGDQGTVALGDDYVAHLADIVGEPPAVQPFRW